MLRYFNLEGINHFNELEVVTPSQIEETIHNSVKGDVFEIYLFKNEKIAFEGEPITGLIFKDGEYWKHGIEEPPMEEWWKDEKSWKEIFEMLEVSVT